MDRNSFFKCFALGAAATATVGHSQGLGAQAGAQPSRRTGGALGSNLIIPDYLTSGVRRLSREKNFTIYNTELSPEYRVELGEVVLMELQHGLPGCVTRDGTFRKPGDGDRINPQTGPVYIEGIEPGDALAVDLFEIRVGDWGYAGGRIFELADGYAVFDSGLRLPLSPMIGGLGIVPAEGEMDTKTPKETGGNMDCREVRAGSTIVFTAQVPGGMVGMGDTHALQGDGEIVGQGIETDAEVLVRFRRLPEKLSDRPVILRPELVATVGAHEDLNEAAWQATDDMADLVAAVTGRPEREARMLVSMAGNLKINQIVDPWKGARMEVPSWVFGA
ncbi:MAG: acetamidase/formamidase family protein [Gemmatimonadota bacterium]|nr:acetamidase/formamidase family protein [Gemmatimonadota bacterium]